MHLYANYSQAQGGKKNSFMQQNFSNFSCLSFISVSGSQIFPSTVRMGASRGRQIISIKRIKYKVCQMVESTMGQDNIEKHVATVEGVQFNIK